MTTVDIALIAAAVSLLASIIILAWILKTDTRLKRFFLGKRAGDLEEAFTILAEDIEHLKAAKERLLADVSDAQAKLRKSIRRVETVRFNPFSESGSNQSFAISFLDEEGDGVVLSSIYSRERMSVFAKPIKAHDSEYELTEEERKVSQAGTR